MLPGHVNFTTVSRKGINLDSTVATPRSVSALLAAACAAVLLQISAPAVAQDALPAVPTISSGHNHGVERLKFSPDGRQLLSGAGDQLAKLWDVATGRLLRSFSGLNETVGQLDFSADGKRIVGTGGNKNINAWDSLTGKLLWTIPPPDSSVSASALAVTRDGQVLVDYSTPLIRRFDLESAKRRGGINPFVGAPSDFGQAFHMALSPDEQSIALGLGTSPSRVSIVNAATGASLRLFDPHAGFMHDLAFSPDNQLVASAQDDKTIQIHDIVTGQVRSLSGSPASISQIAWSPDGKRLYSIATVEKAIRVWDVARGALIRKIETPVYWSSLALSPDGRTIATGDTEIDLWDTETGALIRKMEGGSGERRAVSVLSHRRMMSGSR